MIHRAYGNWRRHADPDYRESSGWFATLVSVVAMQYCVLMAWIAPSA